MTRIGSVEILKARIYKLDAECHCLTPTKVVVQPGVYWLYRDGLSTYWMMRGTLNRRGPWRMGDGMFSMSGGDNESGIEVEFPSRRFGPDEWAELIAGPEFTDGPGQRLKLTLLDEVAP